MCNKDGTDSVTNALDKVLSTMTSIGMKAKNLMGFKEDIGTARKTAEADGLDQEKLDAEIEKLEL
jgi:hypothetical protein